MFYIGNILSRVPPTDTSSSDEMNKDVFVDTVVERSLTSKYTMTLCPHVENPVCSQVASHDGLSESYLIRILVL